MPISILFFGFFVEKGGRSARYAWQVEVINLLIALARERNVAQSVVPLDVIQLAEQILIGRGQPAEVLSILLNRLQAQVYTLGSSTLGEELGFVLIPKVADIKANIEKKFRHESTSKEHTIFTIDRADLDGIPGMRAEVENLKGLGYLVFDFDEAAVRAVFGNKINPRKAIGRLAQLAAILGKTEFMRLMADYGVRPRGDANQGFSFSVEACLVAAIKTLISKLAAQQSVGQAA